MTMRRKNPPFFCGRFLREVCIAASGNALWEVWFLIPSLTRHTPGKQGISVCLYKKDSVLVPLYAVASFTGKQGMWCPIMLQSPQSRWVAFPLPVELASKAYGYPSCFLGPFCLRTMHLRLLGNTSPKPPRTHMNVRLRDEASLNYCRLLLKGTGSDFFFVS